MSARILIVEDEVLVALELQSVLEDAGYEVVGVAPDRNSAERHAETADLALVDLNLRDGLTGPEIGRTLGGRGASVLFITANPNLVGGSIPNAIGAISKPADESVIKTAVEYALLVRLGRAAASPPFLRPLS